MRNLQQARRIPAPRLRQIARTVLGATRRTSGYDVGILLVDPPRMARLNETYLGHAGSTDVITFDYRPPEGPRFLHGEIVICVAEALRQARRYGRAWPEEVARYLIHGLLHLLGYDDQSPAARRVMKREENRWLRQIRWRFPLSSWNAQPRLSKT